MLTGTFSDLTILKTIAANGWIDPNTGNYFDELIHPPFNYTTSDNNIAKIKDYVVEINQDYNKRVASEYYYVFPYLSGLYTYSGFVIVPKGMNVVVSTGALTGCSINIYDNIHPLYRVFLHDEHADSKVQTQTDAVVRKTAQKITETFWESYSINLRWNENDLRFPDIEIKSDDHKPPRGMITRPVRYPWVFSCANNEIHAFMFCKENALIYKPKFNTYIYIKGDKSKIISNSFSDSGCCTIM